MESSESGFPATDLAYIAGFFDGEGWIGILPRISHRKGRAYPSYALLVGAAQCDPRPLAFIVARFGGSVGVDRHKRKHGKSVLYQWQLYSSKAEAFLRAVYPYLIHKKQQAEIAFAFRDQVSKRPYQGPKPTTNFAVDAEYAQLLIKVRANSREAHDN